MIPSIVAAEVNAALRDFLMTGFSPSNPEPVTVMDNFLAEPGSLAKGPYLSVAMPFQEASEGGEAFPEVPIGFTPYRHQRSAFSRLFEQTRMLTKQQQNSFRQAVAKLPPQIGETVDELAVPIAVGGLGDWAGHSKGMSEVFAPVPLSAVQGGDPNSMMVPVNLHDDVVSSNADDYRRAWNATLRLFNSIQFLPQVLWTTGKGTAKQLYPEFVPADGSSVGAVVVNDPGWVEAIELVANELKNLLSALAEAGLVAPKVGFELVDGNGAVLADAELAWQDWRLAVMLDDNDVYRQLFEGDGGTVLQDTDGELMSAIKNVHSEEVR